MQQWLRHRFTNICVYIPNSTNHLLTPIFFDHKKKNKKKKKKKKKKIVVAVVVVVVAAMMMMMVVVTTKTTTTTTMMMVIGLNTSYCRDRSLSVAVGLLEKWGLFSNRLTADLFSRTWQSLCYSENLSLL